MTTLDYPDFLRPPVSEELLSLHDFFDIYPLDGGGNFITCELFGSKRDTEIADALIHGSAMEEFGGLEHLDFRRFERWRSIEKSCWLNRFYFVVPLARTAWLRKDAALARKAVELMCSFARSMTPPADLKAHWEWVTRRMNEEYNSRSREEIAKDETDVEYVWYDMQPGQRLICFLYALWFLRDFPVFSGEETEALLAGLKLHARVLARQDAFQTPRLDNHQSLRASALCWALPLLEGEPDYEEIKARTLRLCEWHVLHEFRADGTLYENSPSYHIFVLWHIRDCVTLAKRRQWPLSPEVEARYQAACRALACYCRPDGTLLTVNDGFSCDCTAFQEALGGGAETPEFAVLPEGGLATGRCGNCYAALDVCCFVNRFSHYHGGKNAPVVLWKGMAFLEDAGCPSYDSLLFPLCKRSDRHSSLLVDDEGDSHAFGLYGFDGHAMLEFSSAWTRTQEGAMEFASTLTSTVPAWEGIRWTRTLALRPDGLRIRDRVEGSLRPRTFTLVLMLAPEVEVCGKTADWLLRHTGGTACRLAVNGARPDAVRIDTVENCRSGEPVPVKRMQLEFQDRTALESELVLTFR